MMKGIHLFLSVGAHSQGDIFLEAVLRVKGGYFLTSCAFHAAFSSRSIFVVPVCILHLQDSSAM
jgi:hypothetical protein